MALDNLKIIRLEAENVKRLKAVEITPSGDLVEVIGKNRQGKTSVLDCILWALGGEKPIQWKPIREGEESAHIVVDLGNDEGLKLRVVRRFSRKEGGDFSTTLKVTTEDGMRPQGEQTLLNTIVGALSFDPSAFVRAKPEEQVKLLKSLIPGVDFAEIAKRRATAYSDRTEANRSEKSVRLQAAAYTIDPDTPAEPLDTAPILEKIRNAGAAATEYHAEISRREGMDRALEDLHEQAEEQRHLMADFEAKIIALRGEMGEVAKAIDALRENIESLPALGKPADTSALSDQLSELQATNRKVEARQRRDELVKEADAHKAKADSLTEKIEACDREVISAIERAELPVRGLEIRDDMVYLRGVPFEQASDAEQLRTSMAMGMAANPKLRVLRIRDGSLLDEDALEIIREVAQEENFQIWIERVGNDGGPEAILMVDGEVAPH